MPSEPSLPPRTPPRASLPAPPPTMVRAAELRDIFLGVPNSLRGQTKRSKFRAKMGSKWDTVMGQKGTNLQQVDVISPCSEG